MSDASAPAACPTITIRVPPEVKALFSELAAKQGVSESALALRGVRWLLDCADRFPPHPVQETGPATDRITIRLRPGDGRGIAIRASRRAMKPSAYLAGLVRAHIALDPPLATTELAALKQAVAILAGIGSQLALLRARSAGQLPYPCRGPCRGRTGPAIRRGHRRPRPRHGPRRPTSLGEPLWVDIQSAFRERIADCWKS